MSILLCLVRAMWILKECPCLRRRSEEPRFVSCKIYSRWGLSKNIPKRNFREYKLEEGEWGEITFEWAGFTFRKQIFRGPLDLPDIRGRSKIIAPGRFLGITARVGNMERDVTDLVNSYFGPWGDQEINFEKLGDLPEELRGKKIIWEIL